ncbi:hypothetical protein QCA50_006704 [Cerrena zonata]|uniref:Uncharacterized protein n=1 Tax=Cerrena zonata TaxID=2478898 RepID=A0AAW0GE57_9APHY
MSLDTTQQNLVVCLRSRHSAHLPLSLSRYKRQWFITFPRQYGMAAYPGHRIVNKLNTPDMSVDEAYARKRFWYNADTYSARYDPSERNGDEAYISSPIHILLDSDPPVAKLTGRVRTEKSNNKPDNGKEILCQEIEVIMPEEGLLRQCYYCLSWETQGEETRWKQCGDDVYWCNVCQEQNVINRTVGNLWHNLVRDTIEPAWDRTSLHEIVCIATPCRNFTLPIELLSRLVPMP